MPTWRPRFRTAQTFPPQGTNADNDTGTFPLPTRAETELVGLYKPQQVDRIIGSVSVYNLDWEELEPYLRRKFPGVADFTGSKTGKPESTEDHYVIYTPRPLTPEDKEEIDAIRKAHRERATSGGGRKRRAEHSPDGPRRPVD